MLPDHGHDQDRIAAGTALLVENESELKWSGKGF